MTKKRTSAEWVDEQLSPLMSGEAMNMDVTKMDQDDLGSSYTMLDKAEKDIKSRKGVIRDRIIDVTRKSGSPDERGNHVLHTRTCTLIRQSRKSKMPDEDKVRAVLMKNGIDPSMVFTVVQKTELDPSKIQALIETGQITAKEIDDCRKVSDAVSIKTSPSFAVILEETKQYWEKAKAAVKKKTRKKASKSSGKRRKAAK